MNLFVSLRQKSHQIEEIKSRKTCDIFTLCGMWAATTVSSQVVGWVYCHALIFKQLCLKASGRASCQWASIPHPRHASRGQLCERNVRIKGRRGTAWTSLRTSCYCLGIVSVSVILFYFLCYKADVACVSWRWLCCAEEIQQGGSSGPAVW